jgi:hypothetical protein
MKLLGDVPEEHKKLALDLEEAEQYWDSKVGPSLMPEELLAKAYTCLAHDWYQIGSEDDGQRLLEKAEAVCPGYFREVMLRQAEDDDSFDLLVKNLSVELAWMLVSRVKEINK